MPDPIVAAIHISSGGIPKFPRLSAQVNRQGLEGDGHDHAKHYRPIQAVSLQDAATLTREHHRRSSGGQHLAVGDAFGVPLRAVS